MKLAVLRPHDAFGRGNVATAPALAEWLLRCADSEGRPRVWRNNLLFLVPEAGRVPSLLSTITGLRTTRDEAGSSLEMGRSIREAYRHLYVPIVRGDGEVALGWVGLVGPAGSGGTGLDAELIVALERSKNLATYAASSMAAKRVRVTAWPAGGGRISTQQMREVLARDPSLPVLLDQRQLEMTIRLLVGTRPAMPMLPTFLLYLLGLAFVFFLSERLAGPRGALLATAAAATLYGFSVLSITGGPPNALAVAMSPGVVLLCLRVQRFATPLAFLLPGLLVALAARIHWTGLLCWVPGAVAILLRGRAEGRLRGRCLARWVAALMAYCAPVVGLALLLPGHGHPTWNRLMGIARHELGAHWSNLLERVLLSVGWSLFRPPSLVQGGVPRPLTSLTVLGVLIVLSWALVKFSRERSAKLFLPAVVALLSIGPLALVYRFTRADTAEWILLWMVVTTAVPLEFLLSRLWGRWTGEACVLVAAAVVLWSLHGSWQQTSSSCTFQEIVRRSEVQHKGRVACGGGRCSEVAASR